MALWLIKSEPDVWSWDQQAAKGAKGEPWTGVRNHQAKLWLKDMAKGDRAFFYHSGKVKAVVGVVEVIRESYADPSADEGAPWVCVDFKAIEPFKAEVSLKEIKAEPKLAEMMLVKNSRFSVQPVRENEWKLICKMGGVKA
jgi:predicted RNA-binding protein with PUA-like domain